MPPFPSLLSHPAILSSNISHYLSPSSTLSDCPTLLNLLDKHEVKNVHTTIGIHPYSAPPIRPTNLLDTIRKQLKDDRVVCVGECGLDYSEGFPAKDLQLPIFVDQVQIAVETSTPLFIHTRLAHEDTLRILDSQKELPPVVIHCFTGTVSELDDFLSRGFYIGFTGFICKPSNKEILEASSRVPIDKIMIETDAPYMGFKNCRESYLEAEGSLENLSTKEKKKLLSKTYPNVPSALPRVCEVLAQARSMPVENFARHTTDNAKRFFGFE